ncbi:MAG: YafY family transcriptional regulator [Bacteroidales bacterium]|jgi:predicted DNA-binding transcriptional regulator YafY|nr:YafY family transcriptional regulator [Bacteroidales bacterium]
MNRIDRLTAILIQLQTKRWLTASEIANRFEISQRTVYRDLHALDEAGVPIGSEPGKGYFLVDGYHLPPVMFTRDEAGAMLIANKLVEKLTDASVKQNFNNAIDKIKAVLPEKEKEYLNGLNSQVEVFYHHTEDEVYPNNYLTIIQQALAESKCLSLSYHAFYSNEKTCGRIIDPVGLVFYANAWHLIGHCKLREELRDFRVDRILNLELYNEISSKKNQNNLIKYLEDLWKTSELFEVQIWFDHSISGMITSTKYYFGYIDEKPKNNGVVMSFAVTDYNYIAHWLLSFGDKINIIKPAELKNLMEASVRKLAEIYLDCEKP